MVNIARTVPGVIGERMLGGGDKVPRFLLQVHTIWRYRGILCPRWRIKWKLQWNINWDYAGCRDPPEYSRNIMEYQDPDRYVPFVFLLHSWGSLLGVPSKVLLGFGISIRVKGPLLQGLRLGGRSEQQAKCCTSTTRLRSDLLLKICELWTKVRLGGTYRGYIRGYRGTYLRDVLQLFVQGSCKIKGNREAKSSNLYKDLQIEVTCQNQEPHFQVKLQIHDFADSSG